MSRLLTLVLSVAVIIGVLNVQVPEGQRHDVRLMDYAVNRISVIADSYTTGSDGGGDGRNEWPTQVWRTLARHGIAVTPTVAADGQAGYFTRSNHGSGFEDLTVRSVKATDVLVVFFGSRNDIDVDPTQLSVSMFETFKVARQIAPSAKFLVIGPAWPTANPPAAIRRVRDVLGYQAELAGATFVDPLAARWIVGESELTGEHDVHPTNSGHAYLAAKIAPLIGAQLNPH